MNSDHTGTIVASLETMCEVVRYYRDDSTCVGMPGWPPIKGAAPRRRGVGEARFVGDLDDPGSFGLAQSVRRDRTIGIRPPIPLDQTVTGLPAPQRAGVDAGQSTGRG